MNRIVIYLVIMLLTLNFLITACGNVKNPSLIADKANFELPDYTVISQSDNMNREASAWSSYVWKLKLKNPLSEKEIIQLNNLVEKDKNWTYDSVNHIYIYKYSEEDRENCRIEINIDTNIVNMEYEWYDILS